MANTTLVTGKQIKITGLDADWAWNKDMTAELRAGKLKLKSIQFHPSAQNDRMIVRDKHIDGAEIANLYCPTATPEDKAKPLGGWYEPVIDISDCTLGTPANAAVYMEME